MKYPTTRFVFDRKKTATKNNDALIQVEILLGGKKKYVSTGVRVYKDQWNAKSHITNRDDMLSLNDRINSVKRNIDNYITQLMANNKPFDWETFAQFASKKNQQTQTFIDYVRTRIEERTDIAKTTKRTQKKIVQSLEDFGKITTFEQLTKNNIAEYYEWLLDKDIEKIGKDGRIIKVKMAEPTAASYMKVLRTYINDAIMHEKIDRDPSKGIKIKRGEKEQTRWLTEKEVKMIEKAKLTSGSLARVRDLFIFSCYCGLAYSDLMDFSVEKLEKEGKNTFLYGRRRKTGQEYIVLILPKAEKILKKYDYNLPKYSNTQYNKRLKLVAKEAKIDKDISSHWGRITFGFMALNRGVRIEVVSKALGHATISETQHTYSRILKKTVVREMKGMINSKK